MARTTKIVNFSLPPETYEDVNELARQMQTSRSHILREAIKQYVVSERRWQQIRTWGEETAEKLEIKNEDDVERIIHEHREEKARIKSST